MYTLGKALNQTPGWHHKQFIQDRGAYGEDLLDVGCGTGGFLSEARKLGYRAVGIDFDRDNVEIARERFHLERVYCTSLESFLQVHTDSKFDVVTFFEVLEHMDDPNRFIGLVKAGLKPGGYIALSVPNRERFLDPLGEGDYPPNHLTRWNALALRAFLEKNGFEIIKLVIKELGADDVAGALKAKLRFRIAHRMIQRGKIHQDQVLIRKAATLMKIKDLTFRLITTPLTPLLKTLKFQGTGLYCLARLK